MPKGAYWRDRISLILAALIAFAVIVGVFYLDNRQREHAFTPGTTFYAIVLAILLLFFALLLDWARQKPWYQEISLLLSQSSADLPSVPQEATTWEQRAVREVLKEQYRLYEAKLTNYRSQQELQNHFQSRWAHQMKTPLAVLDLLLQQWEAGEVDCEELVSSLRDVRDRLAAGLELMLYNIRLSQFELDFVVQQVDLLQLVRQIINEQKATFIRYGIYPKVISEPDRVEVETDPKWLQFVLRQVLSNALKYSRREGAERTVEFTICRSQREVRVACRDFGIGIPPEDLDRVWQPFFTGTNGRRFPEATGMGLYLAKKVCDQLGHPIAISSEVNRGTTVTITFVAADHLHRLSADEQVWL